MPLQFWLSHSKIIISESWNKVLSSIHDKKKEKKLKKTRIFARFSKSANYCLPIAQKRQYSNQTCAVWPKHFLSMSSNQNV